MISYFLEDFPFENFDPNKERKKDRKKEKFAFTPQHSISAKAIGTIIPRLSIKYRLYQRRAVIIKRDHKAFNRSNAHILCTLSLHQSNRVIIDDLIARLETFDHGLIFLFFFFFFFSSFFLYPIPGARFTAKKRRDGVVFRSTKGSIARSKSIRGDRDR